MSGLTVTFRKARASDRDVYDWKPYGVNRLKPSVVTVQGADPHDARRTQIVLVMEGDTVVWQNGSEGIAELVRAYRRTMAALTRGLDDADASRKRLEERRAQVWRDLADFGVER